jgi:hypothetical protein
VAPQTIYNYRDKHPSVAEAIRAERGRVLDTAELVLFDAVHHKEEWACKYVLSHLGKDRGYSERVDVVLRRALETAQGMSDEELVRVVATRQGGAGGRLAVPGSLGGGEAAGADPGGNGAGRPAADPE